MPRGIGGGARRRRPTFDGRRQPAFRPRSGAGLDEMAAVFERIRRSPSVPDFSTTSTPGRAGARPQNEIGKCSECQAGASIASCRFNLAWDMPQKKTAVGPLVLPGRPAGGEPQAMYGSPSRQRHGSGWERGGRGALCRAPAPRGWFSSSQNICARLPRQKAEFGNQPAKIAAQPPDGVADTIVAGRPGPMMSKCTVSPAHLAEAAHRGLARRPIAPTASRCPSARRNFTTEPKALRPSQGTKIERGLVL